MRIAILDSVNQDIGLKILFPEADYFIHNSEEPTINDRKNSYNYYNFTPDKDLTKINDSNYDCLFIIIALYDIIPSNYFIQHIKNIFEKIKAIINNNNFKKVVLFDNYDFDYDPNLYIDNLKFDLIFKRNYNKNKIYKENVFPFPFIMFGNKSLIEKCDRELVDRELYFNKKENRIFFTGCLTSEHHYEYDKDPNIIRDRKYIYDKIQERIYNPGYLSYEQFKSELGKSKYAIDLLGAGDLTDNEFLAKYFAKEINQLPEDFEMRLFRFCEPDFFVNLFDKIKDKPNLELLSGHLCKSIDKSDFENKLQLQLLPMSQKVKTRSFDSVVITCGTLQTTALLQRSYNLMGTDTFEILGKYLMEHIEGYIGKAWTFRREERKFFSAIGLNNENRSIDVSHGAGVGLALKHMGKIDGTEINVHFEFRAPMPEFYFQKLKVKFAHQNLAFNLVLDLSIFLERSISFILRNMRATLLRILNIKLYSVYLKAEEMPFRESTTFLPYLDENFLVYSHKISEITWQRLSAQILEFDVKFNQRFNSRIKFSKKVRSRKGLESLFGSNWHPMGTTRMGADPRYSVVDPNLAIHGTPNCYVLSASVFPTGSNSNPTFTTLALASRLSETEAFSKNQ